MGTSPFALLIWISIAAVTRGELSADNTLSGLGFSIIRDTWKFYSGAFGIEHDQFPRNFFAAQWADPYPSSESQDWRIDHYEMGYPYDIDGYQASSCFLPSVAILCSDLTGYDCGPACSGTNVTGVQRFDYRQTGAAVLIGVLQDDIVINHKILVTFRGTVSDMEMRRNTFFGAVRRYCDDCLVHRGFCSHWTYMKRWTFLRLEYLRKSIGTSKLVCASLSLGAAMVWLFISDLPTTRWPDVTGLAFGSPRVGNHAFLQWLASNRVNASYNIMHDRDVVGHMPPMLTGYHQLSPILQFDSRFERFVVCHESDMNTKNCFGHATRLSLDDHISYFNVDVPKITLQCGSATEQNYRVHESYDLLLLDLTGDDGESASSL